MLSHILQGVWLLIQFIGEMWIYLSILLPSLYTSYSCVLTGLILGLHPANWLGANLESAPVDIAYINTWKRFLYHYITGPLHGQAVAGFPLQKASNVELH